MNYCNIKKYDIANGEGVRTTLFAQNMLQVDIEKHLKDKSTGIAYVLLSEDKKIVSDLIMVVESPSPMLIYIGGKFNAEKM